MIKKIIIIFLFSWSVSQIGFAQEAESLITAVNKKFSLVSDYKAKVLMKFALPGIRINTLSGKVFYKRPNKFRIRAKGIFFVPKDNPIKDIPKLLANTKSYTSVITGYATVEGQRCAVVNVIPLDPNLELIIGKFWIRVKDPLIYLSEITTKENGTIRTQNFYGNYDKYALPDKILIQIEMKKFKVPKLLAMDVKKKSKSNSVSKKSTGEIYMLMSDYKINTKLPNSVFTEK